MDAPLTSLTNIRRTRNSNLFSFLKAQQSPNIIGQPPPKPELRTKILNRGMGIQLSWKMNFMPKHSKVIKYKVCFRYVTIHEEGKYSNWVVMGETTPLSFPLACRFSSMHLLPGLEYQFAVYATDEHGREGKPAFTPPLENAGISADDMRKPVQYPVPVPECFIFSIPENLHPNCTVEVETEKQKPVLEPPRI